MLSCFAAQLSESYERVYRAMGMDVVRDYVPAPWIALVQVKREYYQASAHHLVGRALHYHRGPLTAKTQEMLTFLYAVESDSQTKSSKINAIIDIRVPKDDAERQQLGNNYQ